MVALGLLDYRSDRLRPDSGSALAVSPANPSWEARRTKISSIRIAVIMSCAHGLNDAYASFVPPLLPRIMNDFGLSIAMATTLAVSFSIASALPQPLFGYLADRNGRRILAVTGPLVSGVFVASIGFASSFWILVLLLTLGGLGSAAFHPPGASYAVRVSEGKGGGTRYSVFSFGGSVGLAVGPLVAVGLVQWRGMEGLWVAMLPVLILMPIFFFGLPSGRTEVATASAPPNLRVVLKHLVGPLGLIFGVSATMAFVQRTFLTMEPIIVAHSGGSEALGAVALTVYLGAQVFGTVTGGLLADRVDRASLLVQLCFWALPAHLLAVWLGPQTALGLVAIGVAGFLGMATLPPIVVMAQEMIPSAAAVSSGIVMGLAWATGSMGVLGTGVLADTIGPQLATLVSMPVIVVAILLALHPTLRQGRPHFTTGV